MLIIGHQHEITFKVQVMGTSAEPTARLCLETTPELCFPARNVGDHWSASATIPSDFQPGSYRLRVEVMVNNRHFVPVSKSVDLVHQDQPVGVPVTPHPEVPMPVVDAPTETIATTEEVVELQAPVVESVQVDVEPSVKKERAPLNIFKMVSDREPAPVRPVSQPVVEKIEQPKPVIEVKAPAIPKKVTPPADLSALQKVAESKPVKRFAPVSTPLPKPGAVKPVEVKVKLGDVVKIAEKKEPMVTQPQAKKPVKPVMELKAGTHIKLIKDKIIYE